MYPDSIPPDNQRHTTAHTVKTQNRHNKHRTTYVYGSDDLLAEGVEKVFSTYFTLTADGQSEDYIFIFATETELNRAVRAVRAEFKATGGNIRKANIFHGTWECMANIGLTEDPS